MFLFLLRLPRKIPFCVPNKHNKLAGSFILPMNATASTHTLIFHLIILALYRDDHRPPMYIECDEITVHGPIRHTKNVSIMIEKPKYTRQRRKKSFMPVFERFEFFHFLATLYKDRNLYNSFISISKPSSNVWPKFQIYCLHSIRKKKSEHVFDFFTVIVEFGRYKWFDLRTHQTFITLTHHRDRYRIVGF